MKISPINNQMCHKTNFRAAIPVFVHVCTDAKNAAPVIGEELNNKFMLKIDHMLNGSLKRGIDKERDNMADRLVKFFRGWVKDYSGNVSAFTCVDGGFENGELKPYFYLLTGSTRSALKDLRKKHKDAVKMSQGYKTANLKIAKDDYYNEGKNLVVSAFQKFKPFEKEPQALSVYFKPIRKKNGVISDYILYHAEFNGVNDTKNPILKLDKQA